MKTVSSNKLVAERALNDCHVQLIEDSRGAYHLRKTTLDRKTVLSSASIHSDLGALSEAREHFPDLLPLGGMPVDAS